MKVNEQQLKTLLSKVFDVVFKESKYKDDVILVMLSYLPVFSIDTTERIASFLAQTGYESQGFTKLIENMNYSTSGLLKTFSRNRISAEDCEKYGRNEQHEANQQAIANVLYGGKFGATALGNTESNDGWNFRGRGWIQHTGRYNYKALSKMTGWDVLTNPSLLEKPDYATYTAMLFWAKGKLNELADKSDDKAICVKVNGGLNGYNERVILKNKIKNVILDNL